MYSLVSKYVKSGPRDNRVKDLAQIVAEYWLNSRVAIKDDNFLESLVQSELVEPIPATSKLKKLRFLEWSSMTLLP
jgi:hypothetical protein